jgi:putative hemin transport protein
MTDTHEFFGLLRRFDVARLQALRLVGAEFARPVALSSARQLLETAAVDGTKIMVFVANPSCIQIYSGQVHRVKVVDAWLNVLDPQFNLHLREDAIASAWVVNKPTRDGIVTSLELFDANGENIALFFGYRKEGDAAIEAWQLLVGDLPPASSS